MSVLPPPSPEQARVIEAFRRGNDLAVTAVAGAGKSTMLIHACAAFRHDPIVVMAYNAALATEMSQRLQEAGLHNAVAMTFHSLASRAFHLCPDDTTMHEIIRDARLHGTQPKWEVAPKHIMIDEIQDMRMLFYDLLSLVFDLGNLHTLICGDEEQMLFDFEQEDPAILDFMRRPRDFFRKSDWIFDRLSVSFRLTPPCVALVNAIRGDENEPLVAGNTSSSDPAKPLIVTCGMFEWTSKLLAVVRTWLASSIPPERIAILTRSVRTAHGAIRTFTNSLVAARIPLYIHGVDAPHERVRYGKVTVATFHACKGLTFDAVITLHVGQDTVEPNPLYVAVSRSRSRQVVVLDRMRPPLRILQALRGDGERPPLQAITCAHTKRLVTQGAPRQPKEVPRTAPALNDVTSWEPRGRAPEVHAAIVTLSVDLPGDTEVLPAECFVTLDDGVSEEVSDVYILAALMREERRLTGKCKRLEQILRPEKASLDERRKRARAGDGARLVDDRSRNDELLPDSLRAMVAQMHLLWPCEASKWCAAAAASIAFSHYHHRVKRLLASLDWVDASHFEEVCRRIRVRCELDGRLEGRLEGGSEGGSEDAPDAPDAPPPSFDHMVRHIGLHTVTQYRCPICVGDTVWLVVFADRIGPGVRARACVPMAVSDEVRTCAVLNVRTGEVQRFAMPGRQPLRDRMELLEREVDVS